MAIDIEVSLFIMQGTAFGIGQFSQFKQALADLAIDTLSPITAEMRRLMEDPGYVDGVLKDGAERAAAQAEPVLREAQDIVGFLRV